jgi:acetoin utilization deacetylase AcuC-like enzyme
MKRGRDDGAFSVGLVKNVPFADVLPINEGRAELCQGLLDSLGVSGRCETINFSPCRTTNLETFHDEDYVHALELGVADAHFGLEYDAHPFPGLMEHCRSVAGATLSAAAWLLQDDTKKIAINWSGGRHHARSGEASGYCFVQDVVLRFTFLNRFLLL